MEIEATITPMAAAVATTIKVKFVSSKDGKPVAKAFVVAFSDFANRVGVQGTTDANGEVKFKINGVSIKIEQLYVYPEANFWTLFKKNITLKTNDILKMAPLSLSYKDAKTFFYGKSQPTDGQGLKVGVIDTGVGPHPDLTVSGGSNTVLGEDPTDFSDGHEHGTHVAGIVAANGQITGLAPAAELFAYRVFGANSDGASNFAIIKAIDQAVADKCDIINMSLGGGDADDATKDAITNAYENGTICFVATGNDGRQPVSFPASFSLSLGVGAMGRKGTFPANTVDANEVMPPLGTDKKDFVAAFSNIGNEVDFIAPGVSIISSVPLGYAPMSGTSMACPAAVGRAAQLLASQTDILNMPRNQLRADAMILYLSTKVKTRGFGSTFEGKGMLL